MQFKFDTTTPKGRAGCTLKLSCGIIASTHSQVLTTEEAAAILVTLVADLAAASAGSSAIQLGKTLAALKAEMDTQALKAFEVMSELGMN